MTAKFSGRYRFSYASVIRPTKTTGEVDISAIRFNERSRDDIPRLLRGLQHVYITPELRKDVFQILEKMIPDNVDRKNGRPGMDLWRVLVLGSLRLAINCGYLSGLSQTLHTYCGQGENNTLCA